jgi:hypothetical protein
MDPLIVEKSSFIEIPTQKIYKQRAISAGAFLGGPLVAGYFIAENFKAFDENEKAKKTWIIAIIVTVFVFGTAFLIPDDVNVPNQIIPIAYTIIASYLAQHFQGTKIKEHIENGGVYFNWWRVIGVGFIGLFITILAAVSIFILSDLAKG